MEFLVEIEFELPPEMPDDERAALLAAERKRGRELIEAGRIRRIWRVPGRFANIGVWEGADATELHDVLVSLPLAPWMSASVRPLAVHPLEAD